MTVYFDACCLSRLTDDQTQPRIREEADAIEQILELVVHGRIRWIASDILLEEISENPLATRRREARDLLALATEIILTNAQIAQRALELKRLGYGIVDALHLASAEAANVDVLLSTDDRLIRRATNRTGHPRIPIQNPVFWLKAVEKWNQSI